MNSSPRRVSRFPFRHILTWLALALVVFGIRVVGAASSGKEDLPAYHSPLPIAEPRVFSEGHLCTGDFESHPAFAPDGHTVYFVKSTPDQRVGTIVSSHYDGAWSIPSTPSFSGKYSDVAPFLVPDGSRLYYASNRPVEDYQGAEGKEDLDIWYVERRPDSSWSEPRSPGAMVNGPGNESFPTLATDGTLYFSSDRAGGKGATDLWRCRWVQGNYGPAENLGDSVNTALSESEPWIAPDQSYLIFTSERPGGRGGSDLYVSRRRGERWSKPANLGGMINSAADEFSPHVSPEGEYFFWTSRRSFAATTPERPWQYPELLARIRRTRNGLGDIYQIDLSALGLRP